jgi:uncharacterized protein (DUF1501 family)
MSAPHAFSRRLFLERGITLVSLAATLPAFLQRSALSLMAPSGLLSVPGALEERILVVIQLGGGNDGLNTVVPYGSDDYRRARPTLGLAGPGRGANAALALDDRAGSAQGIGLHPSLEAMKELYDEGRVAIVQGVGYPNPNRSHFASMDIWQTARLDGKGTGWIGRYFDNACNGTPQPDGAIAIGRTAPLAMQGDVQKPIAFESPEMFRWLGEELHPALNDPYRELTRAGAPDGAAPSSQAAFLMRTALDAQLTSDRIAKAVARQPLVPYPNSGLGRQLATIGAMIRDGLATRVYYASLSGFDTHAGQAGPHANLLRQLAEAVRAFQRDLAAQGNDRRVLVLTFSEFGRRVGENGSGGTDHGTAAPCFLIGPMVRPGLLGEHPSLTDLDEGDLKHTLDFRSLYAGILEDWMGTRAAPVLGGSFRPAKVVATS